MNDVEQRAQAAHAVANAALHNARVVLNSLEEALRPPDTPTTATAERIADWSWRLANYALQIRFQSYVMARRDDVQ